MGENSVLRVVQLEEKIVSANIFPLVSVIIPCFNQGRFLPDSIQSVLDQTYPSVEIILVDDGSTDNTKIVAEGFPGISYYYQDNAGPSAARNLGIEKSKGEYLVFLDGDDLLTPNALDIQMKRMQKDASIALVSGGHYTSDENLGNRKEVCSPTVHDTYLKLLQGNFIGMIATVMFRKSFLGTFRFDEKLRGCEDFDLFLRLTREFKAANHQEMIAVYRGHSQSASTDFRMMLETALTVLGKQAGALNSQQEKAALEQGRKNLVNFYSYLGYNRIASSTAPRSLTEKSKALSMLRAYKPKLYLKYYLNKLIPLSKIY